MEGLRRIARLAWEYVAPSASNQFRPASLSRDALITVVAVTCVVEGFLLTSLFMQSGAGQFAAAVLRGTLVNLTNVERSVMGLSHLTTDPRLTAAAQAKAEDMAARGYFSHNDPDGSEPWRWVRDAGYDYAYAGENLAVRFFDSSDVISAWMQSPSHRANMVKGAYRDIGIGVAEGVYEGQRTTFVVQFFGTSRAALNIPPASMREEGAPPTTSDAMPEDVNSELPEPADVAVSEALATAPVPTAATVEGRATEIPTSITKLFNSPRTLALFILSLILLFLVAALILATVIHMHVQPVDMLLSGAVVAAFVLSLFAFNSFMLSGATIPQSTPAAAVVASPAF